MLLPFLIRLTIILIPSKCLGEVTGIFSSCPIARETAARLSPSPNILATFFEKTLKQSKNVQKSRHFVIYTQQDNRLQEHFSPKTIAFCQNCYKKHILRQKTINLLYILIMCISKMHFFFPFHPMFAKKKLSLWRKNIS